MTLIRIGRKPWQGWHGLAGLAVAAVLSACGGGGGGSSEPAAASGANLPEAVAPVQAAADNAAVTVTVAAAPAAAVAPPASVVPAAASAAVGSNVNVSAAATVVTAGTGGVTVVKEMPASRDAAARFLTQATFGPTDADVDSVMSLGYSAWIDAQFTLPQKLHRLDWDAADAKIKAANAASAANQADTINSFWKQAVTGNDQLRQRVAYALSQIMVVSMQDTTVADYSRGVASYLDVLGDKGFGNYRDLIQSVALHPMMGLYLSSLRNEKADPATGRVPDENFAREVMQLFSIGLHQLNLDGSAKLDAHGQPIPTYGPSDIAGMAKVFTGWGWDCPGWPDSFCFFNARTATGKPDPDRMIKPMVAYPVFHSAESKSFLGVTIAAGSDAKGDLKVALDTLYNHPNVGPFIGRQLIQRLVTSNPSPAYVAAVASAFNNNGAGVRGDMRAVVKAILMNPEARVTSSTSGKLREPVLRLSAYLRAFPTTSDSGEYRVGNTDDPGLLLGQTPLRAPSVFNFYRPGYVAPGTESAKNSLVAPEFQLAQETTAAGYVNFMRNAVRAGVGVTGGSLNRRDIQFNQAAELALADQPAALVERLNGKLLYGSMPQALKTEIAGAIGQIYLPPLKTDLSNKASVDNARQYRVYVAMLLTLASPEFQVQK